MRYWATFNEMNHLDPDVELSDFFTYMNTGLCYSKLEDPAKVMVNCAYNMTLASVKAVKLGHEIDPDYQIDLVSATTDEMKKRYGFIYVDKNDDGSGSFKRYRKDSFCWFQKMIREFQNEE